MSRFQLILTGAATVVALVLVLLSIDFSQLGPTLNSLSVTPVAVATFALVLNFLFSYLRFDWTMRGVGVTMYRRTSAYAFSLSTLAGTFLLNIIGQSLTRAVVLQT